MSSKKTGISVSKNGEEGGLLVGKTDKNGGAGIKAQAPGQPLILGGGEVVINEEAVNSKEKKMYKGRMMTNAEILNDINTSTGGRPIPSNPKSFKPNKGKYEKGGTVDEHISGAYTDKGEVEIDGHKYYVNGLPDDLMEVWKKTSRVELGNGEYEFAKRKVRAYNAKYVPDGIDLAELSKAFFLKKYQPTESDVRRAMIWMKGPYGIKAGGGTMSDSTYISSLALPIIYEETGEKKKHVILKKYSTKFEDVLITSEELSKLQKAVKGLQSPSEVETWSDEISDDDIGFASGGEISDPIYTGGKIKFNPKHIPSKPVVKYAQEIKENYPEIWHKGGNIYGNTAYKRLMKVVKRGYWLPSEEKFYIKWRGFVARHKKDFRLPGTVAMLKWLDTTEGGLKQMKETINEHIEQISMASGGGIRQGPSESATIFPIGTQKIGNDGNMWEVIASGKSQRWNRIVGSASSKQKVNPVPPAKSKKSALVSDRPSFIETRPLLHEIYKNLSDLLELRNLATDVDREDEKQISDEIQSLNYIIGNAINKERDAKGIIHQFLESLQLGETLKVAEIMKQDVLSARNNTDAFAPSGSRSKLSPFQFQTTQMDFFKTWFGDFEAQYQLGGPNSDAAIQLNCSKVVDDNGEPLPFYLFSNQPNFTGIFDLSEKGYIHLVTWNEEFTNKFIWPKKTSIYVKDFFVNAKNILDLRYLGDLSVDAKGMKEELAAIIYLKTGIDLLEVSDGIKDFLENDKFLSTALVQSVFAETNLAKLIFDQGVYDGIWIKALRFANQGYEKIYVPSSSQIKSVSSRIVMVKNKFVNNTDATQLEKGGLV